MNLFLLKVGLLSLAIFFTSPINKLRCSFENYFMKDYQERNYRSCCFFFFFMYFSFLLSPSLHLLSMSFQFYAVLLLFFQPGWVFVYFLHILFHIC